MKRTTLLAVLLAAFTLASCSLLTPEKSVSIGKIGLEILVRNKVITTEDASDALKAGQILIAPPPAPPNPPETLTSGK